MTTTIAPNGTINALRLQVEALQAELLRWIHWANTVIAEPVSLADDSETKRRAISALVDRSREANVRALGEVADWRAWARNFVTAPSDQESRNALSAILRTPRREPTRGDIVLTWAKAKAKAKAPR